MEGKFLNRGGFMQKDDNPRNQARKVKFEGGTDGITGICFCTDFTEVYKVDRTFQEFSPEKLDPENKSPYMQPMVVKTADIGTSNEIIASLIIQTYDFLRALPNKDRDLIVMDHMHCCKEHLLVCNKIAEDISSDIARQKSMVLNGEVKNHGDGRGLTPFPTIIGLNEKCLTYLQNAKLFLQSLANVFNVFYGSKLNGPHFNYVLDIVKAAHGEDHSFTKFISRVQITTKYIVNLRNGIEHNGKRKNKGSKELILTISNFIQVPKTTTQVAITNPVWQLQDDNGTHDIRAIDKDMKDINKFLLDFAESCLIQCVLYCRDLKLQLIPVFIPEEQRKKDCPKRYDYQTIINFKK